MIGRCHSCRRLSLFVLNKLHQPRGSSRAMKRLIKGTWLGWAGTAKIRMDWMCLSLKDGAGGSICARTSGISAGLISTPNVQKRTGGGVAGMMTRSDYPRLLCRCVSRFLGSPGAWARAANRGLVPFEHAAGLPPHLHPPPSSTILLFNIGA